MFKFIIILIGLILIIHFLNNNFYKNLSTDINSKTENFYEDENIEDILSNNKNDLLKLSEILKIIKNSFKGIQDFNDKYYIYKYNNFTINKKIKNEVNKLLKPIINQINEIGKSDYILNDYESIETKINKSKTKIIYVINFFIYDVITFERKKIFTEILFNIKEESVHINHIKLSNCKIIDDCKDEDCYLENKPINTNKQVRFNLNNNKIHTIDKKNKFESKLLDNLMNELSDREQKELINEQNNNKLKEIKGKYKTNLEYQNVNNYKNYLVESSDKRNSWILPENVKKSDKKAWPCNETKDRWDNKGILIDNNKTEDCYGNNYATQSRNLINNRTPDFNYLDRENLNNSDLFKPSSNQHTNWDLRY